MTSQITDKRAPRNFLLDFDLTGFGGRIDLVFNPANGEGPMSFKSVDLIENEDGTFSTSSAELFEVPPELKYAFGFAAVVHKAFSVNSRFRERMLPVIDGAMKQLALQRELLDNMINDLDQTLDEGTLDALFRANMMSLASNLMAVAEGREVQMSNEDVEKAGNVMSRSRRTQLIDMFGMVVDVLQNNGVTGEQLVSRMNLDVDKSEDVGDVVSVTKNAELIMKTADRIDHLERQQITPEQLDALIEKKLDQMMVPGSGIGPDDDLLDYDTRKSDANTPPVIEFKARQ